MQDAIEHSRQAIELNPEYVEAYANLAAAYAQVNRLDEAIADAQKALELARTKGRTDLMGTLESSLNDYRARRAAAPGGPAAGSNSPAP